MPTYTIKDTEQTLFWYHIFLMSHYCIHFLNLFLINDLYRISCFSQYTLLDLERALTKTQFKYFTIPFKRKEPTACLPSHDLYKRTKLLPLFQNWCYLCKINWALFYYASTSKDDRMVKIREFQVESTFTIKYSHMPPLHRFREKTH